MKFIIVQIWPEKYEISKINSYDFNMFVTAKGLLKKNNKLMVGDIVELEKQKDNTYVISSVHKRINKLIRPPVVNVDQMICVLSNTMPLPDLLVLDKLLIIAKINKIKPIICINKCDTELTNFTKYIINTYENIGYQVITTIAKSKKENDILKLREILDGKITILSGASGVGKSSIINTIFPEVNSEISSVCNKINRGKHTTKYIRLYKVNNGYIADTPGFAACDILENINKEDLKNYYEEYNNSNCRYSNCNHINENDGDCEIKKKVINNILDKERYERYKKIFTELDIKEKYKYKEKT